MNGFSITVADDMVAWFADITPARQWAEQQYGNNWSLSPCLFSTQPLKIGAPSILASNVKLPAWEDYEPTQSEAELRELIFRRGRAICAYLIKQISLIIPNSFDDDFLDPTTIHEQGIASATSWLEDDHDASLSRTDRVSDFHEDHESPLEAFDLELYNMREILFCLTYAYSAYMSNGAYRNPGENFDLYFKAAIEDAESCLSLWDSVFI